MHTIVVLADSTNTTNSTNAVVRSSSRGYNDTASSQGEPGADTIAA